MRGQSHVAVRVLGPRARQRSTVGREQRRLVVLPGVLEVARLQARGDRPTCQESRVLDAGELSRPFGRTVGRTVSRGRAVCRKVGRIVG